MMFIALIEDIIYDLVLKIRQLCVCVALNGLYLT